MKKTIIIEGMNCAHCTSSVEKALRAVPGVTDVTVDLASKSATIEEQGSVSDDVLTKTVTDTGFQVVGIQYTQPKGGNVMKFQQIRGATVIITFGGKTFLIDPFFAEKGSTPSVPSPYNCYLNPLVALPVPIKELVSVDAVIVTHMHHFDHFDEAAQNAIPKDKPLFTQSEGEAEDMRNLGFKNVTALKDDGVIFEGITLHRTDAAHGQGEASDSNYKAFGVPSEASGVVFTHLDEKTLYVAGDTVWYEGVQDAINKYRPEVIVLSPAQAAFYDETPILMGTDGVYEVVKVAPEATIIASHMDAVNHARITRIELKNFVDEKGIAEKVLIPEDGEVISF